MTPTSESIFTCRIERFSPKSTHSRRLETADFIESKQSSSSVKMLFLNRPSNDRLRIIHSDSLHMANIILTHVARSIGPLSDFVF